MISTTLVHRSLMPRGLSGLEVPELTTKSAEILKKGLAAKNNLDKKAFAEKLAVQAAGLFDNGHFLEAIPLFEAAYAISKALNANYNVGRSWVEAAFVAEEAGNIEDAKKAASSAQTIFNQVALAATDKSLLADVVEWRKSTKEYLSYLTSLSTESPKARPKQFQKRLTGIGTPVLGAVALVLLYLYSRKK